MPCVNRLNSFQARLVLALVLLLAAVMASVYLFARLAVGEAVREQTAQRLEVGEKVLQRLLEVRRQQLSDAVSVLAADFGFKEAVASGDAPTLRSALLNHAARIRADEALLLDLNGRLIASSLAGEQRKPGFDALALQAVSSGGPLLVPVRGQLHLLVDSPVRAPVPVARVVMGFALDRPVIEELRSLTGLELTLAAHSPEAVLAYSSSLTPSPLELAALLRDSRAGVPHDQRLNGELYLSRAIPLGDLARGRVEAFLHGSLQQAMEGFVGLDRDLFSVTLVALLASLLLALALARAISRPLSELTRVAERIGQGDYAEPIAIAGRDEFGRLARVFGQMQEAIAERERQLAHNALHDAVSGLANRSLALERIGSALQAGRPVGLVALALKNYRQLLDSLSDATAEQLLPALRLRLEAVLGPGDSAARLADDEFLLLLDGRDAEASVALVDRIQQLLGKPLWLGEQALSLDIALGVAAAPSDGDEPELLLRRVDIALQDALQSPERLQVYQQGRDSDYRRQIDLIRDLRHAPQQGGLLLHFQPKLDLRLDRVRQAEALLRWQHPLYGMVSPGEFIPLAERTGSIGLLTAWVIEEGCRQLGEWNANGLHLQLSLNVSADDLLQVELVERVAGLIRQHRIEPAQLVFEITESAVMQDQARALAVLDGLRGLGIGLSVDDFGTGYSSLAQLKRMPVQELKIDQSFVRELDARSEDAVIVRSTIEMSHSLGLKVVAEGVEQAGALALLRQWGCDCVQGYFISRPLPAEALVAWLGEREAQEV